MLSTVGKIFKRRHIDFFSHFSQETAFVILCTLSPVETICMKYKSCFPETMITISLYLLSAEYANRVVKVNY